MEEELTACKINFIVMRMIGYAICDYCCNCHYFGGDF